MDNTQHTALLLSRAAFGVAVVLVLASAMPRARMESPAPDLLGAAVSALPIDSATLANLPDAMVDTTLGAELAIGQGYWKAVDAYVQATYAVRDAAAAVVATIANPQPPQNLDSNTKPLSSPQSSAVQTAAVVDFDASILPSLSNMGLGASAARYDLHPTYASEPAYRASAPASQSSFDLSWLAYVPDSMVQTAASGEMAVGAAYWRAITAYVVTTRSALDAAAALYTQGIQSFVDSTYAARDLSAAAYGGIAQAYVSGITSVHDSQVRSMRSMAESMADGAVETGALYDGLAQWYAQTNARIAEKLSTP